MGTKNPRSLVISGFFGMHLFWMHNMVAEVGFERPTRKYSRLGCVRSSAHPILLIFSLVALPPPRTASGRTPSPLPPPEVVDTDLISVTKRKNHPIGWFSFGCGGGI